MRIQHSRSLGGKHTSKQEECSFLVLSQQVDIFVSIMYWKIGVKKTITLANECEAMVVFFLPV